jgi:DNA mismatch endonuclease (patch repair protein)
VAKIRDKRNLKKLRLLGYKILILWECQIRNPEKLSLKLKTFLKS